MPSKLHIPGLGPTPTACGRNLNNARIARAQTAYNVVIAAGLTEYMVTLHDGKACRHCGREAGIISKLTRSTRNEAEEGEEDNE